MFQQKMWNFFSIKNLRLTKYAFRISQKFMKKIAISKDGILFARSRLLDSQRFKAAGGLEDLDAVKEFGIKMMTPVLDRYSPLSYMMGDYIHRKVAKHAGYENCLRESLNHCFIIHGLNLFKELGEDCGRCLKMRMCSPG